MNTKELEDELSIYLFTDSTKCICKRFVGAGYSEMDVVKVTSTDYIYEYELKVSRSDFLKETKNYNENIDRRKYIKHKLMKSIYESIKSKSKSKKTYNTANKYFFVCPKDLIKIDELLPYQGLIYYDENKKSFQIIKDAVFLHKIKINNNTIFRMLKTLSEREVFNGKSKMTYINKLI